MDAGRYQAIEQARHDAERRRDAIAFGDLFARCAAVVWRGRRISFGPAAERRRVNLALRLTVQASCYFQDAGLGRQAAVCGRLIRMVGQRYQANAG
jgi:hypothetical protein